jgi:hypothetical protein
MASKKTFMPSAFISPFWLISASLALSLAWVLPNHSNPWVTFHTDAWAAVMLSIPAAFVLAKCRFKVAWHWLPVVAVAVVSIPLLQHASGIIPLFGIAWINSVYLLGFLLALLAGAAWEQESSGQCTDYLFLALGITSFVSVGLELHQFFNIERVGPWVLYSNGTRHSANLAQPNQLGTLLMLGFVSVGWGVYRRQLGVVSAVFTAAFLFLGVALTESRTAWVNIFFVLVAAVLWRRLVPSKRFLWTMVGLAIFFVAVVLLLPAAYDFIWGGNPAKLRTDSPIRDARWAIWSMFFNVAFHQPLFGFGWGQLHQAQLVLPEEIRYQSGMYSSAHNIFLDLIIWSGFPIGVAVSGVLIWWFVEVVRRIKNFQHLTLFAALLVLGVHAMLELPLHYAYFLLPAGMMMGCLNTSMAMPKACGPEKIFTAVLFAMGLLALGITIRDYFRVEESMYGLRFEQRKIETTIPLLPPDVLTLTHWHDYIGFARLEPRSGVSDSELKRMDALVTTMPGGLVMFKLAVTMAYNGRPEQAQEWLKRNCMYTDDEQCEKTKSKWASLAQVDKRIAAIPWPLKEK